LDNEGTYGDEGAEGEEDDAMEGRVKQVGRKKVKKEKWGGIEGRE
jgi:hypothetical protein